MKKLFGKRLRELRTTKGLTQEKTAELMGIKPENYSRIENGLSFPKPENIEKISKILNVSIAELFEFEHFRDYDTILNTITEKLKTDRNFKIKLEKTHGKSTYMSLLGLVNARISELQQQKASLNINPRDSIDMIAG